MKIIAWCYNCQQQISFNNVSRNRNGVAIPVDDYGNLHSCKHKNRKPGFQSKNVSDAEKAYILIKIIGQFRENIFHWIGIWVNDMIVTRRRI
jgi:hypothetical protein